MRARTCKRTTMQAKQGKSPSGVGSLSHLCLSYPLCAPAASLHRYCHACLSRYYGLAGNKLKQLMSNPLSIATWQCPACLNRCTCVRCRKDREEAEAMAAGAATPTEEPRTTPAAAAHSAKTEASAAPPAAAVAAADEVTAKVEDSDVPVKREQPSSPAAAATVTAPTTAVPSLPALRLPLVAATPADAAETPLDSPSSTPEDSKAFHASALAAAYSAATANAARWPAAARPMTDGAADASPDLPALHVPPAVAATASGPALALPAVTLPLPLPLLPPALAPLSPSL
jgi:hypothetical protein